MGTSYFWPIQVNVDGLRRNGSRHIGAGGGVRSSSGDWIGGLL